MSNTLQVLTFQLLSFAVSHNGSFHTMKNAQSISMFANGVNPKFTQFAGNEQLVDETETFVKVRFKNLKTDEIVTADDEKELKAMRANPTKFEEIKAPPKGRANSRANRPAKPAKWGKEEGLQANEQMQSENIGMPAIVQEKPDGFEFEAKIIGFVPQWSNNRGQYYGSTQYSTTIDGQEVKRCVFQLPTDDLNGIITLVKEPLAVPIERADGSLIESNLVRKA